MEHYQFDCRGEPWHLNGYLIEAMGIDDDTCQKIALLHNQKRDHLNAMAEVDSSDKERLHELYNRGVARIEYLLQEAWGWSRDANWHKHWEVPHCTCPVERNRSVYPRRAYFAEGCPVHGKL